MSYGIQVSRNHSLGIQVARAKAEQVAASLKEDALFKSMTSSWVGNDLRFEIPLGTSKVTGVLLVSPSSLSVCVDDPMPLIVRLAKGKVEKSINDYLNNAGLVG